MSHYFMTIHSLHALHGDGDSGSLESRLNSMDAEVEKYIILIQFILSLKSNIKKGMNRVLELMFSEPATYFYFDIAINACV